MMDNLFSRFLIEISIPMAEAEWEMMEQVLFTGFAAFACVVSATLRLEVPVSGIALGLVFAILGILLLSFPFIRLGALVK